jgi:choline dehydrogenase-like flavoprotein
MPTPPTAQPTAFSKDVLGRYVCNGLDEALASTDSSRSADARMFDIIILGGGSFGAVCAQHLFTQDTTHSHRILVLEAGPVTIPEHVQNLPVLAGLNVPGATSIQDLRNQGQFGPDKPREEVWGLAWHSSTKFPGLAYCVGGRSLYFGGWCPQLLDEEMLDRWPQAARNDLDATYFAQASEQIGTNVTNDFISGPLHTTLRQILFDGIQAGDVTDAIPLNQLPVHPPIQSDIDQLEAPLAVQSQTRPGLFPFNKFSSVPVLIKAARAAFSESGSDDFKKRLMIVPRCHVIQLLTENIAANGQLLKRVHTVQTDQGPIAVPQGGVVIVALGTIESTRMALLSFGDIPNADQLGRNLIAHLRSNVTIRIPRSSLPGNLPQELMASALFVKGRHRYADNSVGHFHLQITAAGLGNLGTDSEAELFKKIPDIDTFDAFANAHDQAVVITIRGIGEMQPDNPVNQVRLDPELDESSVQRSFVSLPDPTQSATPQSQKDRELWDAIDRATDQVAKIFANGSDFEIFTGSGPVKVSANTDLRAVFPYTAGRRDGIGTTHHEAGSLRMGTNSATSATNADGRLHAVANTYIAGPALFPSLGSPNPMLTGVALARRLVDRLVLGGLMPSAQPIIPDAGFQSLFAGTAASFEQWQVAGMGNFSLSSGEIVAQPEGDLGLLYLTTRTFSDFLLKLEFKLGRIDDNSGIFVRFRNPRLPVPDRNVPGVSFPYNNQAFVAVDTGFEIQIDELARGNPDGLDEHRTGAIYGIPIGQNAGQQDYRRGPALVPGQWNTYEIEVRGNTYTVRLNGQQTTNFTNTDLLRGKSNATDPDSGYIGVQSHTGRVTFRNIQIRLLPSALAVGPVETGAAVRVPRLEMPMKEAEAEPTLVEAKKRAAKKHA